MQFFLGTRQELKVMILAIRTIYSLEMRGTAVPVILFNLFSNGGLEYQPAPKTEIT